MGEQSVKILVDRQEEEISAQRLPISERSHHKKHQRKHQLCGEIVSNERGISPLGVDWKQAIRPGMTHRASCPEKHDALQKRPDVV